MKIIRRREGSRPLPARERVVSWRVECRPTIIKSRKDPFAETKYPQSGAYQRIIYRQEPPKRVTRFVVLQGHYLK